MFALYIIRNVVRSINNQELKTFEMIKFSDVFRAGTA